MNGDGWVLVGPAAFKAVVRRAERLGCVRFAYVSAIYNLLLKGSQAIDRFLSYGNILCSRYRTPIVSVIERPLMKYDWTLKG